MKTYPVPVQYTRGWKTELVYVGLGAAFIASGLYMMRMAPETLDDPVQKNAVEVIGGIETLGGLGFAGKFGRDLYRRSTTKSD